jgi:5'-nucleotidase
LEGLPQGVCLNVNFPSIKAELIEGIKICRQSKAIWEEVFEERIDPSGKAYYWLTGNFKLQEEGTDTDEWALRNNYISVVPVQIDFTAHEAIPKLLKWKIE